MMLGRCLQVFVVFALLTSCVQAAWQGTDEELIEAVEYRNWLFFKENQGGEGTAHLFYGSGDFNTAGFGVPQIAGDGFGIAALCVGAYRGWMDEAEAYRRIDRLLETYDQHLERAWYGFYNHWNDFNTGQPAWCSDTSGVDTAWFLCGALLAAEYFKGTELANKANRIFDEVQWRNCQDPLTGYTEFLIMNIIGSGSPTFAWNPQDCRDAWHKSTATTNYWAPLFVYQWPQCYVDFRNYRDDHGANHYEIARDAIISQRWMCIRLNRRDPKEYKDYGPDGWGLTSASASPMPGTTEETRYLEMRPWAGEDSNGRWHSSEYWTDSGTLVPICLPACMAHTPDITLSAMKNICNNYEGLFGKYSFPNAFNTGKATSGKPFKWGASASMDFGANVLAMENYRSGMPWAYFMKHPVVRQGLERCGLVEAVKVPLNENFDTLKHQNAWGGRITKQGRGKSRPKMGLVKIKPYNEWVKGRALRMSSKDDGDTVCVGVAGLDASRQQELSFWMAAPKGKPNFSVALRDTDEHTVAIHVTNGLDGPVSSKWSRVRIPLKCYAVSGDPNHDVRLISLDEVRFVFHGPVDVMVDDLAFVGDDIPPQPPRGVAVTCLDGVPHIRWGRYSDDDVVGFHCWRYTEPDRQFERITPGLLSAIPFFIDNPANLQQGKTYYYAVQSIDRHENAGPFSSDEHPVSITVSERRDFDWSDGLPPNTLGGRDGCWGAGRIDLLEQEDWRGGTRWLRTIESTGEDCGGYITCNNWTSERYDTLTFWIKTTNDLDAIAVGLKSTKGDETKHPIARYSNGSSRGDWLRITAPLSDFGSIGRDPLDNLSFTFASPGKAIIGGVQFE